MSCSVESPPVLQTLSKYFSTSIFIEVNFSYSIFSFPFGPAVIQKASKVIVIVFDHVCGFEFIVVILLHSQLEIKMEDVSIAINYLQYKKCLFPPLHLSARRSGLIGLFIVAQTTSICVNLLSTWCDFNICDFLL